MGLSLPGLALAEQLYLSVQAKGWGRNGTHALMLALAEMAESTGRPAKPSTVCGCSVIASHSRSAIFCIP